MYTQFSFVSTMPVAKIFKEITDRYEETCCPVGSTEHSRKEFEPSIISIHDKLIASCFQLCEPGILVCKCRGCIGFGDVQYHVKKRWNGPCRDGLQTRHRDRWRACMSGKWKRCTGSNQAIQIRKRRVLDRILVLDWHCY